MYQILLTLHSVNRWLVLMSMFYALFLALRGYFGSKTFDAHDNLIRHLTATIAHIQLLLGFSLYMISPVVKFANAIPEADLWIDEHLFFKYIHIALMILSVMLTTIGSARAKRMETDQEKFRTMFIWFSCALLVIFIAIPWPFSPLANRPLFRSF